MQFWLHLLNEMQEYIDEKRRTGRNKDIIQAATMDKAKRMVKKAIKENLSVRIDNEELKAKQEEKEEVRIIKVDCPVYSQANSSGMCKGMDANNKACTACADCILYINYEGRK